MEFSILKLLTFMVLPPSGILVLAVAGLVTAGFYRRTGVAMVVVAMGLLYVISTPLFTLAIMSTIQPWPALDQNNLNPKGAETIVILGGGRYDAAPEYGADTVSHYTLERLRYGAWLKRRTGLPLLLTGGNPLSKNIRSEAELMKDVLIYEYALPVKHIETNSNTTYENARYSAGILKADNIGHILLVTHAWHMPRAVAAFEQFGLRVTPAPTAFYGTGKKRFEFRDIVPRAESLHYTSHAIHEIVGHWWYRLRYY